MFVITSVKRIQATDVLLTLEAVLGMEPQSESDKVWKRLKNDTGMNVYLRYACESILLWGALKVTGKNFDNTSIAVPFSILYRIGCGGPHDSLPDNNGKMSEEDLVKWVDSMI